MAVVRIQGKHSEPSGYRYKPQVYYISVELRERFKAAWWATRDQAEPDGSGTTSIHRSTSDEILIPP